jgi:hypothetical protein
MDALEDAGFHVDRAYEESYQDAGCDYSQDAKCDFFEELTHTGAICLRATPVKKEDDQ